MAVATSTRVLVVDDEESLRHMLSLALSKDGYHVWTASSGSEALELLRRKDRFDICVSDIRMAGMDGLAFIQEAARLGSSAPTFVAMSAYGDEALAVEALRRGAFDYISKPFAPEDLSLKLRLIIERRQLGGLAAEPRSPLRITAPAGRGDPTPPGLDEIVSVAPSMEEIFCTVRKVASFPTTVLITGETGTGKERIAGAIHREGVRARRSFVAVNCGAIPENLLESQLFGHVQGAFTDARADHAGLFEVAHGGSLFLDEIAELPLPLQVKLLRALVGKEIRRVGDTRTIPVDVRVIAATAQDLYEAVRAGRFREDLYYRLNVVTVHLPPLRERREDVEVLARHFVTRLSERLGLATATVSTGALARLQAYDWPGNVRELENAIERALVLSEGDGQLTEADLDERFDSARHLPPSSSVERLVNEGELSLKVVLPRVERLLIERALEQTQGNRTRAAKVLGISHRALLYKLKEYSVR